MPAQKKLACLLAIILLMVSVGSCAQAAWIHAKAILAQQLLRTSWHASLLSGQPVRPWAWADTWPVAQLTIPSRDVDVVILEGGNGAALPFGPGHLSASAAPGTEGISIVVAHRDTHFSFLGKLLSGERLIVTRPDKKTITYKVSSMKILDMRKDELRSASMNSQLILVTCYPFDAVMAGTPYRYVVTADAVTTPVLTRM